MGDTRHSGASAASQVRAQAASGARARAGEREEGRPSGLSRAQAEGGLGTLVGYRLKQVQAGLRSRIDSVLRPLGLTTPQYACLELLSRVPGASGAELARGAFVSRQTMNVVLRSLQDRGLVTRSPGAVGGRALPLELTSQGEELCQRAAQRVAEVEELMVSGLSDRQGRELHKALTACAEALGGGAGSLVG